MINTNNLVGKAGIYLRLSREDGDKFESDSIKNQRQLINDFLRDNPKLRFFKEYADDGYSGTNFDRPAFQRLLTDAKNKRFDCIILKDLSRLGRNYIETGKYLEKIFPSMGIRVIALNDNYDSNDRFSDENQFIVPFKNLINDAYCRDISMKIRSHFDIKRKSGQFIGNFATYGYLKDPEDKNRLIIDEYAATIVTMIFDLKLSGMSIGNIGKKLEEMKVEPPYDYKRRCGLKYNSGFKSHGSLKWPPESIKRILTNEMYTGKMVQGKQRKINYKVKKSVPIPKEDWIRVPDTHDAIISVEKFDAVQKLLLLDTRTAVGNQNVYPLSGYLKCADCGQNMIRRSATMRNGTKVYYYHCSTHKSNGSCSSHNINAEKIESLVLDAIKQQFFVLIEAQEILEEIQQQPSDDIRLKIVDKQLVKLKSDIEYYNNLKVKVYRDYVDNTISKDDYLNLNSRFQGAKERYEKALLTLEEKQQRLLTGQVDLQTWIDEIAQYRDVSSLNRNMVVSLIDSVQVFENGSVQVNFIYDDEIKAIFEKSQEEFAK
jgi:site-specific DNA recombinase